MGATKLKTAPHATATAIKGGQMSLVLDEPIRPDSMKERLACTKAIATHLGAHNFFGAKPKPAAKLPAFAALVDRLD